jgi:hypothetical protein
MKSRIRSLRCGCSTINLVLGLQYQLTQIIDEDGATLHERSHNFLLNLDVIRQLYTILSTHQIDRMTGRVPHF